MAAVTNIQPFKTRRHIMPIAVMLSFLVGCATQIEIRSEPSNAKVWIKAPGQPAATEFGATPIQLSTRQIQERTGADYATNPVLEVRFELTGYEQETILVPFSRFVSSRQYVDVKLKAGPSGEKKIDLLLQYISNAQLLASNGEFERALIEIDKAIESNPRFSRSLTTKAGILVLQKKPTEALIYYDKALAIDPNDSEAMKMSIHLRKKEMK